ncbi:MAG: hypothetical protein KF864_04945 [Phycisphaeraceae bacterium]|nr:hypothetical protein [Phycisphaeraceae bacterium]
MYRFSMPVISAIRLRALATNSGPLSLRMCTGTPRMVINSVSTSTTSAPVMHRSTSAARHSV